MGVIDAKDADAACGPEFDDAGEFGPKGWPVGVMKVEWVDVLIFFGGIFGVFDGAVWALIEPVGMVLDIGVIGGAIDGKVQGQLQASGMNFFDEPVEIFESAEFGSDVFVAATVGAVLVAIADGIRDAGFACLGSDGVIFSFAGGEADGVDGGKVDDINAHGLGVIDAGEAIAKGRAAVLFSFGGAGEEFVPLAEKCLWSIDIEPWVFGLKWQWGWWSGSFFE